MGMITPGWVAKTLGIGFKSVFMAASKAYAHVSQPIFEQIAGSLNHLQGLNRISTSLVELVSHSLNLYPSLVH